MLTKSPCGILLKLIYDIEKNKGNPIDGKELLKLINKMQNEVPRINIYNIQTITKENDTIELISFDFWNDLSILNNSGRIKIHRSDPLINITMTGSLSADTMQIPEYIEEGFYSVLSK